MVDGTSLGDKNRTDSGNNIVELTVLGHDQGSANTDLHLLELF